MLLKRTIITPNSDANYNLQSLESLGNHVQLMANIVLTIEEIKPPKMPKMKRLPFKRQRIEKNVEIVKVVDAYGMKKDIVVWCTDYYYEKLQAGKNYVFHGLATLQYGTTCLRTHPNTFIVECEKIVQKITKPF